LVAWDINARDHMLALALAGCAQRPAHFNISAIKLTPTLAEGHNDLRTYTSTQSS
jgi:hypothetical protein